MKRAIGSTTLSRRGLLKLGAAAASLGVLRAWAPGTRAAAAAVMTSPDATATPKRGGTLTMARTASPQDFDPLRGGMAQYIAQRGLYNSLLHYDAQLNPQPELAVKWEFAPDGRTLMLKVREGVKFHTGRGLTSQDVKFSVEYGQKAQYSPMYQAYQAIKGVETPDSSTVVLNFDKVNPSIFDLLDVLWVVDKDAIGGIVSSDAGTGPFRLERYVPNDRVEMVPFKDYWDKGKPYLDKLVIRQVPDASTLVINLEAGAVDCVFQPSFTDVVRLRAAGGKYIVDPGAPSGQVHDIALNVKFGPLKDKRVRQAIAWSMDRARFCKTALQGLAEPTCLIWPRHSWAYFKDLEGKIGYDLDKAKVLLKEAGMEKGFDVEILTSSRESPSFGASAAILQADLKKIGVNARVSDVDAALYNSRLLKGDIEIMIHEYGRANRDPGTTLTGAKAWYVEKEGAWTHFESTEWVRLRDEMQSTMDREKRKAVARKVQEMALDECFTIVVSDSPKPWAYTPQVRGFTYDLNNAPFSGEIWLDK